MREHIRKPNMGGLLALLLLGIFAVCILSVLLLGADAYRTLVQRGTDSYDRRTAVQYISTRVRQADWTGGVYVRAFEGRDALVLAEELDGIRYETMIYCHDGYLRELFSEAAYIFDENGYAVAPEDGDAILPADLLQVYPDTPREQMLQIHIQLPGGTRDSLTLSLRSGKEVGP